MKTTSLAIAILLFVGGLFTGIQSVNAQMGSDLYEEGSVWNVTYVRTHANMTPEYMKGLSQTWAAAMEKYVDAGLIISYKILSGEASNDDDFNLMLMIEFESFAMMDPDEERDAKFDAIEKEVMEEMGDEYKETIANYGNIREILGSKTMREMHLKK
jgi:hypothetical protein